MNRLWTTQCTKQARHSTPTLGLYRDARAGWRAGIAVSGPNQQKLARAICAAGAARWPARRDILAAPAGDWS